MKILFALLSLLALTAALDVQLTKSYFYFSENNKFSTVLYQTKTQIIAQSMESPDSTDFIPQYVAIDLNSSTVTPILQSVSSACDVGAYVFNKVLYHSSSATLMYYCTQNNSILILDEQTYDVTSVVSIGGSDTYKETRLTIDGDFVVIIGINDLFDKDPTVSQFVRFNALTKELTSNFSFNGLLSANETVVAYASNKLTSYVLATQTSGMDVTASVYLLIWVKDIFKLVHVVDFKYSNDTEIIHHLECVGDFIVTNTDTDIIFINSLGNVVANQTNVTVNKVFVSPTQFAWEPVMARRYGNTDLFAHFLNDTLVRFDVTVTSISYTPIGTAAQMQFAAGSVVQDDLFFLRDDQTIMFKVVNTQLTKVLYERPYQYRNLMLTNSTYAVEYYPNVYIFDLNTDSLVANATIPIFYFQDIDNGYLYYLNLSTDGLSCQLHDLDLTTGQDSAIISITDPQVCKGRIASAKASATQAASPYVTISLVNGSFLLVSDGFGQAVFNPSSVTPLGYVSADYTALSIYYVSSSDYKTFNVSSYTYDNSTNQFTSNNTYQISGASTLLIHQMFSVDDHIVVGVSNQQFILFDLTGSKGNVYSIAQKRADVSLFRDSAGSPYLLFSESPLYASITKNNPPTLVDEKNNISPLPDATPLTVQAGAAGLCSYWLVNGMISSVGIVDFYSSCSSSNLYWIFY